MNARGDVCSRYGSLMMNRRRLEEGLIACLPWYFEGGKHGVEGGARLWIFFRLWSPGKGEWG